MQLTTAALRRLQGRSLRAHNRWVVLTIVLAGVGLRLGLQTWNAVLIFVCTRQIEARPACCCIPGHEECSPLAYPVPKG